jgi:hypothetical protein
LNRGLFWPFTGPRRYVSGRCADGVTIRVSGQAAARGRVPKTASIGFTTDALHAGQGSYSPVYFDRTQFEFPGKTNR